MITLILCLRPIRVPKYVWFKILYDRRYEFGREMTAGEDRETVFTGACTAGNYELARSAFNRKYKTIDAAILSAFASGNKKLINFLYGSRVAREKIIYAAAYAKNDEILEKLKNHPKYEDNKFYGYCRGAHIELIKNKKHNCASFVSACLSGNIAMVREVLITVFDCGSSTFLTAFDFACEYKHIGVMQLLLDTYKYDISSVAYKYVGQEIYEIMKPHIENDQDHIDNCMLYASRDGNVELIDYFYKLGGYNYKPCLHIACSYNREEAILYWVSKEVSIAGLETVVCQGGNIKLIKKLIHLFNIDHVIKNVYFDILVSDDIIELLLDHGAKRPT